MLIQYYDTIRYNMMQYNMPVETTLIECVQQLDLPKKNCLLHQKPEKNTLASPARRFRRGDVLGLESILLETNSLIETSQPRPWSLWVGGFKKLATAVLHKKQS